MKINAGLQVIGFIVILFSLLLLYKYFTTTSNNPHPILSTSHLPKKTPIKHVDVQKTNENKIDDTINMNANDLQIVNNQFHMYQDDQHIETDGFENELGNDNSVDKAFAPELDELYQELMTSSSDTDELIEYSKAQKSDLPIANVPVYLLTKNEPLRLSEKPK